MSAHKDLVKELQGLLSRYAVAGRCSRNTTCPDCKDGLVFEVAIFIEERETARALEARRLFYLTGVDPATQLDTNYVKPWYTVHVLDEEKEALRDQLELARLERDEARDELKAETEAKEYLALRLAQTMNEFERTLSENRLVTELDEARRTAKAETAQNLRLTFDLNDCKNTLAKVDKACADLGSGWTWNNGGFAAWHESEARISIRQDGKWDYVIAPHHTCTSTCSGTRPTALQAAAYALGYTLGETNNKNYFWAKDGQANLKVIWPNKDAAATDALLVSTFRRFV